MIRNYRAPGIWPQSPTGGGGQPIADAVQRRLFRHPITPLAAATERYLLMPPL